jgi:hypothetical protein
VAFLVFHQIVYEGWTAYASADHFVRRGEFSVVGFHPNYLGRSQRLAGLLVARKFGIAAWQPAWLFAVPALGALVRARPAGWAAVVAPLAAGYLTATFVALTMHGFWVPGRQIVVVLPLAVVATAWWIERARAEWPFAAAAVVGVFAYAWLVPETASRRVTLAFNFWNTGNPLYQVWRHALPDYIAPKPSTWPLHAVWTVLLLGLLVLGWRMARSLRPR